MGSCFLGKLLHTDACDLQFATDEVSALIPDYTVVNKLIMAAAQDML